MKSCLVVAWITLLISLSASAQTVRITWIGHASFLVQSDGGPTVMTDPPAPNNGYPLPATAADAVTVTHSHTDHNFVSGVVGSPAIVDGQPTTERGEATVAGLPFLLIPGFHDNRNGAQRGRNTIIRWTQSGLRFAHFGDYGQDQLTEAQLADLQGLDVIFVPAGGVFTIDAAGAAALAAQLRPRVAILMHFRTALGPPGNLAAFPAVADPFPAIVYKPSSVVISRDQLPASTQIWLMEVATEAAIVNAASFTAGVPVATGSLASVFGSFPGAPTLFAAEVPLPRRLGNVEVLLGGAAAPLLYVSPTQINFQVGSGLSPRQSVLEVRVDGQRVARAIATVAARAPGLFAVVNEDGRINSAAAPARRGQRVLVFATGQGEVAPPVADGVAAPADPLSGSIELPEVSIGGRRAPVSFSGLAPTFVGLWQINVIVPGESPAGPSLPLVVTHGLASNTVAVAVQ